MRTNIYQLLAQRSFDPQKEYSALWTLFCIEKCYYSVYGISYTLAKWVDQHLFRGLSFRGSFTSLSDMMQEFGFHERSAIDIDKLLLFCEFLIALLSDQNADFDDSLSTQCKTIAENITYILNQTNHELSTDADGNHIIVEKNKTATLAAQLVNDTTVAFDLIEYNHFAIKGHLEEKKKLLVSIASYLEPILQSKTLSNAGYKNLESDVGFILNNFHIRHNNKEGTKANGFIASINNNDLEEWYDKAYELALSVIIINDYLSIEKDIEDIKPRYTWKT